ncbi:MAG: hypothetical protein HPM95_17180 [Alphaproteobacteria bacterium]|nr:hypothetical protein [Alphaproteobacteria bacterium]
MQLIVRTFTTFWRLPSGLAAEGMKAVRANWKRCNTTAGAGGGSAKALMPMNIVGRSPRFIGGNTCLRFYGDYSLFGTLQCQARQ